MRSTKNAGPASLVTILGILLLVATAAAETNHSASLALNLEEGFGQFASISNEAGLEGLSAITIEAWVHPISFAGSPTIVGNDRTASTWLGLDTGGHLRFYTSGGMSFTSGVSVPLDTWTHVCAQYEGSSGAVRMYYNGLLVSSFAGSPGTTGSSAGDFRIGADRDGATTSFFWHGHLDEVRIWNVVRPAADILRDMRLPSPVLDSRAGGAYTHLIGSWGLDHLGGLRSRPIILTTWIGDPPPSFDRVIRPQLFAMTALELNGTDDHVALGTTNDYSNGLTLMAWVYPGRSGVFQTLFGRDYETSFWFGLTPDLRLSFYPRGGVGAFRDGTHPIPLKRWTHVAATYKNNEVRLYINGELEAEWTDVTGPILENGRAVFVGADNNATGPPELRLQGRVRMARILYGVQSMAIIRDQMSSSQIASAVFCDGDVFCKGPIVSGDSEDFTTSLYTVTGSDGGYVQGGVSDYDELADDTAFGGAPYESVPHMYMHYTGLEAATVADVLLDPLLVPLSVPISGVEVFVSLEHDAGNAALGLLELEIRLFPPWAASPADAIRLFDDGPKIGWDFHTLVSSGAPATISTGRPPYLHGVVPRDPFGPLYGHDSNGTWNLEVHPGVTTLRHCRLNAWGMRINGVDVAAVPPSGEGPVALSILGPHPFADRGRLSYRLARAAEVRLELFDTLGRRVAVLERGRRESGDHEVSVNTSAISAGVYFVQLHVRGGESASRRVVVAR